MIDSVRDVRIEQNVMSAGAIPRTINNHKTGRKGIAEEPHSTRG